MKYCFQRFHSWVAITLLAIAPVGASQAQLVVGDNGGPAYTYQIQVPPGSGGLAPRLALNYSGAGANGIVGYGWSLQGTSSITRCAPSRALDGVGGDVSFAPSDKLCLDGQRLIQTDAQGNPVAQQNDAAALTGSAFREYRLHKDNFTRVRAYGSYGNLTLTKGPAYFIAWTKSGEIHEFGQSPGAVLGNNALVTAEPSSLDPRIAAWALSRVRDRAGNYIDFKYIQSSSLWGSKTVAGGLDPTITAMSASVAGTGVAATTGPQPGPAREWYLAEIQYSGQIAGQSPSTKIIFSYGQRVGSTPQDASEAFHKGFKAVSLARLQAVTTYINSPNPTQLGPGPNAVPVKTIKLGYDNGPVTGRSRLVSIQDCAGNGASGQCLPATKFEYSKGPNETLVASTSFNLKNKRLLSPINNYGTLVGDFNADGRSDILLWTQAPDVHELWLSKGDGSFERMLHGTNPGQFNLTQPLFIENGCLFSFAADVNGDGVVDLVRIANQKDIYGNVCAAGGPQSAFLINDGNGGFELNPIALSTGVPIALNRLAATETTQEFCGGGDVPPDTSAAGKKMRFDLLLPPPVYCRTGIGWTEGSNFYLLDLNGDGRLDIITARLDAVLPADPAQVIETGACVKCTRVFIANAQGTYDEKLDSNLVDRRVYSAPGGLFALESMRASADVNQDGWTDLDFVGMPGALGTWISLGDGNFSSTSSTERCEMGLDFNGDGRSDCLLPAYAGSANSLAVSDGGFGYSKIHNFNLTGSDHGLKSSKTAQYQFGSVALDLNGDGRDDILKWHDLPEWNRLYLSNGDGTFTESQTFTSMMPTYLRTGNGAFDFIGGDFLGTGGVQLLRLARGATDGTGWPNQNLLMVPPGVGRPADLLIAVTSSTGSRTSLTYTPVANPGDSAPRYRTDRTQGATPNPKAATWPMIDVALPLWVVTNVTTDSGVGTSQVATDYSYLGLKADTRGNGLQGFREIRRQSQGANGDALTSVSHYLQQPAYQGLVARAHMYAGAGLADPTGLVELSKTINTYCDAAKSEAEALAATETVPCDVEASLVRRPYLRKSEQTKRDLNGVMLPAVTTVSTVTRWGDVKQMDVTTIGKVAGVDKTYVKRVESEFCEPDSGGACPNSVAGDNWRLGLAQRTKVSNKVPELISSVSTSFGSAPNASATTGPLIGLTLPALLDFAQVAVTQSPILEVRLTNTGTVALNITKPTAASVTGSSAFTLSSTSCNAASLGASQHCSIYIKFAPTVLGPHTGELKVMTQAGPKVTSLKGSGTAAPAPSLKLSLTSGSGNFGAQTVNTTSASLASFKLKNEGNAVANAVAVNVPSPFGRLNNSCGTALSAGDECSFQVSFTPTQQQSYSDSVTVTMGGVQVASLSVSGVGTAPPAPNLELTQTSGSTSFGTQAINTTSTGVAVLQLKNNGNAVATEISVSASTGFALSNGCSASLNPSQSCSIELRFSPTLQQVYSGNVTVKMGASVVGSPALSGTGGPPLVAKLEFSPATLPDFGGVTAMTSATSAAVTLKNAGTATANNVSLSAGTPFEVVSSDCPSTMLVGGTCTFRVKFSPTLVTAYTGSVSASATGVSGASLSLKGAGTAVPNAALTISMDYGSADFGDVPALTSIGKSSFRITNNGSAATVGLSLGITGHSAFSVFSANRCGTDNLGVGDSCTFTVNFAPLTTMATPVTATVSASAAGGVASNGVAVSGRGTSAPAPGIGLSYGGSSEVNFGPNIVNTASTVREIVLGNGGNADATGLSVSVTGPFEQVASSQPCGTTLAQRVNCYIAVRFKPTALGQQTGSVTVTQAGGFPQAVMPLKGNGIAAPLLALVVSPAKKTTITTNGLTPKDVPVYVAVSGGRPNYTYQWTISAITNIAGWSPIQQVLGGTTSTPTIQLKGVRCTTGEIYFTVRATDADGVTSEVSDYWFYNGREQNGADCS
ncbi:MAG: choice-of-anchor D domain-containing protein [Burkholderiaceae bacterium]|nr:choice-of-anchor D domain-containing protein [Burkholderiaceae bacterium]